MTIPVYRLGAVLYGLWGVVHILGGGALIAVAATDGAAAALALIGSARPSISVLGESASVTAGLVAFHGFNLLWIGVLVLIVAARLNWRNSRAGYWLNLSLVGAADLGLIMFLLVPGEMALADGVIGPLLFVPAAILTAFGRRRFGGRSAPEPALA